MIFEGKITQTGTSNKPSSKLSSRAFDVVKNVNAATHLRLKGSNEFIPINEDLIIMRKKYSDGSPANDFVHYTQINSKEEFVCIRNGKESVIDGTFYVQVAFMKPSERGAYLRCDDGVYIHKDEIQVPAYKKVSLNQNSQLKGPVNNGQFYVQQEEVVLPNGQKVTLPNDRVKRDGDNWLYLNNDNEWVKCQFRRNVDTRKQIKYVLLDDSKIVDIQKLQTKPNGEFVLKDVEGKDIVVGKKTVELEHPFIEGSTMEVIESTLTPTNLIKQQPRIEQGGKLAFVWRVKNKLRLKRVDVNISRTKVVYTYDDGHKEIYALPSVLINKSGPNDKEYRVGKIDVVDMGEEGVKIEFLQKKHAIAQKVQFVSGKLNSCTINDRQITNIQWQQGDDYSLPTSYMIDGVMLSDIEWHAGEIKSCVVHLVDDDGNRVEKEVADLKTSEYKDLAITYEPSDKIEDLKTDGETISFKIGDYRFVDAEIVEGDENNRLGKCKLKYKGKEEEIDLRTDKRFRQLRIAVNIAIDEQRIVPLIQSQLLTRKNGKYELEADVIQAEEMKTSIDPRTQKLVGGVCNATSLKSVSHAVREQENFKNNPFKSTIIDDRNPNKTHTISDFRTSYESSSNFDIDNNILPNLIGKDKVTIKDGDIEIEAKKDNTQRDNMILRGFGLCSNPFTIVFGVGFLLAGTAFGIVAPIARSIRKARLKNQNPDKIKKKIQDNAAEICKTNINKLVSECRKELNNYKKYYSQEEYDVIAKGVISKFKHAYHQEVAKLQMLGGGAMRCEFDPTKKSKMIPASHLAYLEYLSKRKAFEAGTKDSPRLKIELKRQLEGLTGNKNKLILKEVELLEKYGGRDSQIKAHKLKLKNFDVFLNNENARRAGENLKGIEPEDYRKQLDREFNAGKAVWGNVHDKIDAYKHSIEYIREGRKKQREMLEEKRKELRKEANGIKINSIDFDERLDKNGNPMIELCTQSCMSYLRCVVQDFEQGNTNIKHKFDFDFYEKLDDKEKSRYVPNKLSEASVRRIDRTAGRRCRFDMFNNRKFVNEAVQSQEQVAEKVVNFADSVSRHSRTSNYEKLFEVGLAMEMEEEKIKKDCDDLEEKLRNIPNAELNSEVIAQTKRQLTQLRAQYTKQKILVKRKKQELESAYERKVGSWALQEFAQTHKAEYAEYEKRMQKFAKTKGVTFNDEFIQQSFYPYMVKNNAEKAESYNNEFETYKIKHHIEENIEAETFCEVKKEEYLKFIEDRNQAQSSTGTLDPNSEIARCYFYAYCKKEKPFEVDTFKRCSTQKNIKKAKQRIKDGQLVKHEPKIIRGKDAKKTAQESQVPLTQGPAPVLSTEAGLTA